jgi:hypothetical protein
LSRLGRLALGAASAVVLSACLQDRVDRLQPQVSLTTPDAQTIPMHVAVFVPPAVSGYVWRGNVTGTFVGSAREAVLPLGAGLESATLDACRKTFRDCLVVRDAAAAGKYPLAIEPMVKDYLFRPVDGVGFSLGFKGELTVAVKFHESGRLVLEKDYRGEYTGESKTAFIYTPGDIVRAHESSASGAVAKAAEAIFGDVW